MNHFTLQSLYSYFKHLSDNKTTPVEYNSKELKNAHVGNSCIVFDKHFDSVIPDPQLEFILESQGIFEYSAELVQDYEFKHNVCNHGSVFSETFYPNITGDKWNPYIRFKSSSICGTQQCSKLLDLSGLGIKNIDDPVDHDHVFNSLVLSYPFEIDQLLLDEKYRSRSQYKITKTGKQSSQKNILKYDLIDRMNRCFSNFIDGLYDLLNIPRSKTLGCCDRLHLWSSEVPFMPNAHHHANIPHFVYNKTSGSDRDLLDDMILDPLIDEYDDCVVEISMNGNDMDVDYESPVEGIHIQSSKIEKNITRYIVDQDRYDEFRLTLSKKLSDLNGFESLPWYGSIFKDNSLTGVDVPLDADQIRDWWTTCVYDEFSDILGDRGDALCDIFIKFIPHSNKAKLLHDLQYATRPPVGDLDLFLKKCDVVQDYRSLDLSAVKQYLLDQFVKAVLKEKISQSSRYESMISKFESLLNHYSDQDFYSWIQFLSIWNTQTKVRGFWRNIKRYMLDPDHKFLIDQDICPLCGDPVDHVRYVSNPYVDYAIVRNRSNLCIYEFECG